MQEGSEREKLLRAEQATAFGRWRAWTKCTRWAYDLGILGLLAALGLALLLLRGGGAQDTLRWVTSGLAFAACAGEAGPGASRLPARAAARYAQNSASQRRLKPRWIPQILPLVELRLRRRTDALFAK